MSFENRMRCLRDLKDIGFQTGCGFMVGSPFQTPETLAEDLKFIETFRPAMCGIGPFIPQKDTPFGDRPAGTAEQTVYLLSLLRLMQPKLLLRPRLPSEPSFRTDANAGLPLERMSSCPISRRSPCEKSTHSVCRGRAPAKAAQCIGCLSRRCASASIGANIVIDRGDVKP